jgi:molybdopterin synthase catalytic subunit
MITAYTTASAFDHLELYRAFLERETDSSGTVVLHHGRVKRPGKVLPDFSAVELRATAPDADRRLAALAGEAQGRFGLNQALLVHRLGRVGAGDSVLLAIVSAKSRREAFEACAWLVDEVKKAEFIELVELA